MQYYLIFRQAHNPKRPLGQFWNGFFHVQGDKFHTLDPLLQEDDNTLTALIVELTRRFGQVVVHTNGLGMRDVSWVHEPSPYSPNSKMTRKITKLGLYIGI